MATASPVLAAPTHSTTGSSDDLRTSLARVDPTGFGTSSAAPAPRQEQVVGHQGHRSPAGLSLLLNPAEEEAPTMAQGPALERPTPLQHSPPFRGYPSLSQWYPPPLGPPPTQYPPYGGTNGTATAGNASASTPYPPTYDTRYHYQQYTHPQHPYHHPYHLPPPHHLLPPPPPSSFAADPLPRHHHPYDPSTAPPTGSYSPSARSDGGEEWSTRAAQALNTLAQAAAEAPNALEDRRRASSSFLGGGGSLGLGMGEEHSSGQSNVTSEGSGGRPRLREGWEEQEQVKPKRRAREASDDGDGGLEEQREEQPVGKKGGAGKKKRGREDPKDLSSRKYVCPECRKLFARPSALTVHERSHTKAQPHVCPDPTCKRPFSVPSNLRRHQRLFNHYGTDSDSETAQEPEIEAPQAPPSPSAGSSSLAKLLLPPDSAIPEGRVSSFGGEERERTSEGS